MSTPILRPKSSSKLRLLILEDRINPTPGWTPTPTPPPMSECLNLGIATEYNAFVFDDFHAQWTETEGRLAVGGSAHLQGYGVGARLDNSAGRRDDLIVGGNLNYTYGQTFAGNIVYGGNANLTSIGSPGGSIRKGNVIDFAAAEADLISRSNQFAALPANGTAVKQWGSITLTGTDTTRNVFNLTAADFQNCWGLSVNVPQNSVVVINVSGTDVTMQYFGIQLNGTKASKVLFNFSQAERLNLSGIGVEGSVLAPKASVNFNNGNIRGNLIAESFCGMGELRYVKPEICVDKPVAKASLGGFVGWDTYCDYGNPTALANVTVVISGTTATGTVTKTTSTDNNGNYSFGDLTPGKYNLSIVVPAGHHEGESIVGDKGGDVMNATTIVNITVGADAKAKGYNFTVIPLGYGY